MSLRLLIIDDQALVRAGFRKLLESSPVCRSSARPPTAWRPSN
jgi:DNA-binding NarL/FixJ family response regulator